MIIQIKNQGWVHVLELLENKDKLTLVCLAIQLKREILI